MFATNGSIFVPFAEVGAIHVFGDSGRVLANEQGSTSDECMGTVRLGARTLVRNGLLLDASLGHNSRFEENFDSLDAGLFLSRSF